MASHDKYGKELMHQLLGDRWSSYDSQRSIAEAGVRADLDDVIIALDSQQVECAVEIEARVYKQIRGAIVDLALHSAPKKLLVVIKAQPQLGDTPKVIKHCTYVWQQVAGTGHGGLLWSFWKEERVTALLVRLTSCC
ncbi:MAG TPA: hypothetical protein VGW33_00800 [Terriglobia bacterium]|nr:hypothetical protein [Terriglobia bacterium]